MEEASYSARLREGSDCTEYIRSTSFLLGSDTSKTWRKLIFAVRVIAMSLQDFGAESGKIAWKAVGKRRSRWWCHSEFQSGALLHVRHFCLKPSSLIATFTTSEDKVVEPNTGEEIKYLVLREALQLGCVTRIKPVGKRTNYNFI